MKLEGERLTAYLSSVFNLRGSRVLQGDGVRSPVRSLFFTGLLVLTLGAGGAASAGVLDGLQLHVEFENNVVDSSLNGFDGQASGDVQYSAGVIGQAAIFDGIDDQVLFPTFLDTVITDNDFSIAFWFDLPTGELLSVLGKREICAVSPFFDIRMGAGRVMAFEVSDLGGFYTVATPATTSGWHHVVFTRSGTVLQAFLDGKLVDQGVTPATLDFSNTATLGLSNSPCVGADGTQMLEGGLDDLRIYNRLLTDFEIASLGGLLADGFESGDTSGWSSSMQ